MYLKSSNKTEGHIVRHREETLRDLQGINSQAEIIECNLASSPPDLDKILGLQAFDLGRVLESDANFLQVRLQMGKTSPFYAHDIKFGHFPDMLPMKLTYCLLPFNS